MPENVIDLKIIATIAPASAELQKFGATAEQELGAGGRLGKASTEGGKGLDSLDEKTNKLGKSTGTLGGGVGTLVTAFAGAAIVEGVADDFEKLQKATSTLNQAMADAGQKVEPDFEAALRKAQEQGESLGFSAADTTTALANLRLAGVDVSTGMKDLPVIEDLARARGIDLATATDAVIKGMQGQGRALKDLNIALPQTLGSAATLAQTQAALASSQHSATTAQDAYNASVQKYGADSPRTIAAHQQLIAAQQQLEVATRNNDNAQNSLTNRTANLAGIMDVLQGKVGGQAKAHTHDLGVEWEIAKDKFNDAGGTVIGALLPAISQLAGVLTTLADHANVVIPVVGALVGVFLAMKVVAFAKDVIENIGKAIKGLSMAMDFLAANPIVLAIGLLIAALVFLELKFHFVEAAVRILGPIFHQIGTVAGQVFHNIGNVVASVISVVVGIIRSLVAVIAAVISPIVAIFSVVFTIVSTVIRVYLDVVIAYIKLWVAVIGAVIGVVAAVFSTVFGIVGNIIGTAIGVATTVIKTFVSIVSAIVSPIIGFFGAIGSGIVSVFRGVASVVGGVINAVIGIVKAPINAIISAINFVIGLIDAVQVHIHFGPVNLDWDGLQIPKLPQLATGAIVKATPGGVLALLAEGGQDEAVTPLPRGWQGGSLSSGGSASQAGGKIADKIEINVATKTDANPNDISRAVVWGFRTKGRVPVAA